MENNALHTDPTLNGLTRIRKNTCYELSYHAVKNRVYFNILGFWKDKKSVPDFLDDWDKALVLVAPGFTLLIDMRTMITHPQQLNSLHEESQRKMRAAGVTKVAYVMPTDKIASLQVADISTRTDLSAQHFDTCEAAEQWLNQTEA
jgi:hypothetical protein